MKLRVVLILLMELIYRRKYAQILEESWSARKMVVVGLIK